MPNTAWQTLEEAALTLGISSRTLHRRIAKNEVQTRLENGRREVLVTLTDPSAVGQTTSAFTDDPIIDAVTETISVSQPTDLSVNANTLLALHDDRIRRTDLAITAYQQSVVVAAKDARRSRSGARVAWATVAVLSAALFATVTWATQRVTKAQADLDHLSAQVQTLSATADSVSQQAEASREQAETARVAAARSEGELTAIKQRPTPPSATPATQPTHILDRITQALIDK